MSPSLPRTVRDAFALAFAVGSILPQLSRVLAADAGPIAWRDDYAQARAEASSRGRLVWIQFTGPWCHNCQRMERDTFPHPVVAGLASADFVPVKLRADLHEELALGFGLSCLPATVLLRPGGEVVASVQGYMDPESCLIFLQDALAREGRTRSATAGPVRAASASPAPRLGLDGRCPVSLVDGHRLVDGSADWSAERGGVTYRFTDAARLAAFHAMPERYLPSLGGRSPVSRVDRGEERAGSPNWGVLYDGHLYLCGSAAERARFVKNPRRYARVDPVTRAACPHCWAVERLIVRKDAEFPLARDRRSAFPPEPLRLEARRSQSMARRY